MSVIKFTIKGEPASKANARRLVAFHGRPQIIKSQKALDYEHTAQLQIPVEARQMIAGPVRATIRIFYATERPDLDESVILDVLQAKYQIVKGRLHEVRDDEFAYGPSTRKLVRAGVYVNDRQVREKHIYHFIDKINPRAEIEIEPLQAMIDVPPVEPAQPRARRPLASYLKKNAAIGEAA